MKEKEPESNEISRDEWILRAIEGVEGLQAIQMQSEIGLMAIKALIQKADFFEEHEDYRVVYLYDKKSKILDLEIHSKGKFGFKLPGEEKG